MCWSFGTSAVLAVLGIFVTLFLALKKRSSLLWIPIFYFSLMEAIQALSYLNLNDCTVPMNQVLTLLGYIHITFQPFFVNMFTMYFIPKHVRTKIQGFVYAICFISAIFMLIKVYPFVWSQKCIPGVDVICGEKICSTGGNWHLAWDLPLNNFNWPLNSGYTLAAFALPLLYGAWRVVIYHALLGPGLAYLTTTNPNEWPAVWCLFSIAYVLASLIKPIRNWLHVKKWYFWKYLI